MKTRTGIPLGVLAILAAISPACVHVSAVNLEASRPSLASAHRISAWSGVVRIAVGDHDILEGGEVALVESTITGLIASVGSDVRVACLEHEGEVGTNGVVHARVRLDFPARMTLEQKFATLELLQGLNPTGSAYRLETPLVGQVHGPSPRLASRR